MGRLAPFVAIGLAVCFCLSACSIYPRTDGVTLANAPGVDAIRHSFGVRPLDPASPVPLTRQALTEVAKTDPFRALAGSTYSLSESNSLPADWLLQTPNAWGKHGNAVSFVPLNCPGCDADFQLPHCVNDGDCATNTCRSLDAVRKAGLPQKFCVGHSDLMLDRIYDLIVSARQAVDITLLQPPADLRFRAAIRNALTALAASGRDVTVRVMVGNYPPDGTDIRVFIADLSRDLAAVPASRLQLYVGTIRTCNGEASCKGFSWNHAKMIAVDGARALVGGHNLYTTDYLLDAPVHDLSMQVDGPAAADAHRFADQLWGYVCSHQSADHLNESVSYRAGVGIEPGCLDSIRWPSGSATGTGGVRILSIGRLGTGLKPIFADQSLVARDLLLEAATKTLRFVLQDVGFSLTGAAVDRVWPDAAIEDIVDLITKKGGDAYIVLSEPGASAPSGSYSNGIPLQAVADYIKSIAAKRSDLPDPDLTALLCQHLHIAPLRFGPDDTWPGQKKIAVHTKFWMIDDRAFYIGSENLYPVDLQEFGYVVEDGAATATIRQDFWTPLWQWSSAAAVTGSEAKSCLLTVTPPVAPAGGVNARDR